MLSRQKQYVVEVGVRMGSFVPAKLVKQLRRYPNDYRKILSDLRKDGMAKRIGTDEQRFGIWAITGKGLKALRDTEKILAQKKKKV